MPYMPIDPEFLLKLHSMALGVLLVQENDFPVNANQMIYGTVEEFFISSPCSFFIRK